jgi:hypothetical protein
MVSIESLVMTQLCSSVSSILGDYQQQRLRMSGCSLQLDQAIIPTIQHYGAKHAYTRSGAGFPALDPLSGAQALLLHFREGILT